MLHLKTAIEGSSAHGLPRIATTGKPVYVRIAWLFLFLLFLSLFLRGFIGFVGKLQSRRVTSSLEASTERFQFPDIYACFQSPVSGTYAASMDAATVREFDARLNDTDSNMLRSLERFASNWPPELRASILAGTDKRLFSFLLPPSLPYQLLVDSLAHRAEQSVISSAISYIKDSGLQSNDIMGFTSFYHQNYLRCFRWILEASVQDKLLRSGTSGGMVLYLMLDNSDSSLVPASGNSVATRVFLQNQYKVRSTTDWLPVHVPDWALSPNDFSSPDRRAGVRIFLAPPGEYPTDFTESYLLAPGRHHVMEVVMTKHNYKPDQFDCLENPPAVQFVNPYNQTPYNHEYSYSYCYYNEFHRGFQAQYNLSGPLPPLPWPLRSKKFMMNLTGQPSMLDTIFASVANRTTMSNINIDEMAQLACRGRDRCSLLTYDATISSADWPTSSSLNNFLDTTVAAARASTTAGGLAVPALDFLLANATSAAAAAAYVRSNLLKLEIRPKRVLCDRLLFAIDYGLENFISDIGGIMGIYLGMSLLTLCEFIELIVDIARFGCRRGRSKPSTMKVNPIESGETQVQQT